jgi:large subunit ribosomal protein L21
VQAIIEDRGRQYVVHDGERIQVDHLAELEVGAEVVFDKVLALGDTFGAPNVDGASVKAVVESHEKGPKLMVYKFRRRKDYRRKQGHRQEYTWLTITSISS